jgi:hypothetical protein
MFTHPEHVIAIHRRQVLEATREHERGGHARAAAPAAHPTNKGAVLGRIFAAVRRREAPRLATRESAVAAQR